MSVKAATLIRDVPDFPTDGILFRDITPVLLDPEAFREALDAFAAEAERLGAEIIVAIESRGFIFGAPVADRLGLPFVPVRKLGKLPGPTVQAEYALEYGTNTLEMHRDAVKPGQKVLIIDDLLATGGTAGAAARLVEDLGGVVVGFAFLVELCPLRGRDALEGYNVLSLVQY
ncbi:MAG: adenine phosphoribosyltransferase [Armatimonadota bacterium]